jgi:hypothetical protein
MEENNTTSEAEILKKLQEEKNKRAQQCWSEIQKALKKYKCEIVPAMQLSELGIKSMISIEAK